MAAVEAAPLAILVEDDPDLAVLLEFILQREGYQVEHCADGRAARNRLSGGNVPKVIVLDVMLPYIDGFELIQLIRQKAEWAHVPVLMLTGQNREDDAVRALDFGADDFVVKPFQPEELKARLRRLHRLSPR